MTKDNYKMSKLKKLSAKSFARLKRSPLIKQKFIKYLLPLVLASTTITQLNPVAEENSAATNNDLKFRTTLSYIGKFSSQNDNIIKAFKEGRARSITEFLKLYEPYFKYDTIKVSKNNMYSRMCLGQYLNKTDSIEIKYFVPDTTDVSPKEAAAIIRFCKRFNQDALKMPVKAHECSHKGFHNNGGIKKILYTKNNMNPDFFASKENKPPYKVAPTVSVSHIGLRDMSIINQWNEIGADLGYLIAEREVYLETRDKNVFTYTTKYTDAVKNGTIDPFDVYGRDKEYALLINSTIEWWTTVKKDGYAYTSLKDVKNLVAAAEKHNFMLASASIPFVFQKRIETCLTHPIDGRLVNFLEYVTEENKELTPQPMVEKYIVGIEQTYPLYQYNDKPLPNIVQLLRQNQNFYTNSTQQPFYNIATFSRQQPVSSSGNNNNAIFTWSAYQKGYSR